MNKKMNSKVQEFVKELEKAGYNVSVDDEYIRISYYTKKGGEECVECPYANLSNIDIAEWFCDQYNDYDVSYETYLWLDNTGHGKDGAPHEMEDVLADKQEWEKQLDKISDIAAMLRV